MKITTLLDMTQTIIMFIIMIYLITKKDKKPIKQTKETKQKQLKLSDKWEQNGIPLPEFINNDGNINL